MIKKSIEDQDYYDAMEEMHWEKIRDDKWEDEKEEDNNLMDEMNQRPCTCTTGRTCHVCKMKSRLRRKIK